jgi:hypothetical protein
MAGYYHEEALKCWKSIRGYILLDSTKVEIWIDDVGLLPGKGKNVVYIYWTTRAKNIKLNRMKFFTSKA